jgi:AcrR family transcriptional regulator
MPDDPPKRRGRPPAGGREAILSATLELLRERGIGQLTMREVARAAGVSEASIFYHYTDRAGLLRAVFEEGVAPLQALGQQGIDGATPVEAMTRLAEALERFLDRALPVITASQSDTTLRDALAEYMAEGDLGPHRGVQLLGEYLAREQSAGRVRGDIDPHAVAVMLISTCFMRASQRQMPIHSPSGGLPSIEEVVGALGAMLKPEGIKPEGIKPEGIKPEGIKPEGIKPEAK